MTCSAMVLNYYGEDLYGAPVNPGSLNTWLSANNGYNQGVLYWSQAASLPSYKPLTVNRRVFSEGESASSCQVLNSELSEGYPVIVEVNGTASSVSHYVVVTGMSGSKYEINDPGWPSRTSLFYYKNNIFETVIYERTTLPDGLYRASNENTIFLVQGGKRRAFTSDNCYKDWVAYSGLHYSTFQTVSPSVLYGETTWDAPIDYLIKTPTSSMVYWVTDSVNGGPGVKGNGSEQFFARPIYLNLAGFDNMNFRWGDIITVPYNPTTRFHLGNRLSVAEPKLVVTDGPYMGFANNNFLDGWRVRNLSNTGNVGLAVTTRIYKLNTSESLWLDFPWSGISGLSSSVSGGWSPSATYIANRNVPRGSYNTDVIYSYTVQGTNYQYLAPLDGENPYPASDGVMNAM